WTRGRRAQIRFARGAIRVCPKRRQRSRPPLVLLVLVLLLLLLLPVLLLLPLLLLPLLLLPLLLLPLLLLPLLLLPLLLRRLLLAAFPPRPGPTQALSPLPCPARGATPPPSPRSPSQHITTPAQCHPSASQPHPDLSALFVLPACLPCLLCPLSPPCPPNTPASQHPSPSLHRLVTLP
ncbi:hypothetical protein BS50DRAFT_668939, partial [Corynespora cassiicola Philippines]